MIARMGCRMFHFEARFANLITLDSEEGAALKSSVGYEFIKP